ncbi:MAG: DUF1592 domain-containing protein [Gemmataceae bacterium]
MRLKYGLVAVGIGVGVLMGGVLFHARWFPANGADETPARPAAAPGAALAAARHFDSHIAPLLARHCWECHGAKVRKGRLDLSRKETALAGGKSGKAIVPANRAESLLWQYVETNEMPPKERPPLSDREKQLLREWIDAGAIWSSGAANPLAFTDERIEPHQEFLVADAVRDPGPILLRRLTVSEYVETVRSAVGVDVEREARRLLPPDLRADGFSNTAYNLTIDLGNVEAYAQLAEIIVGRMDMRAFASRFTDSQELSDANRRALIAGMGKWLLRGPLQEQEITTFLGVSSAVIQEGGDFTEVVRYLAQAMLQSPRFLYRIEDHRGDGRPRRVSDYELASRISYILWGGPPDQELLRAADAGELSDQRRLQAQVERMLRDPRAVERSAQFIEEWLHLDQLAHLRPNPKRFPRWNEHLAADMRAETLAFFQYVVWEQKRPLADLLNAQVAFATPRLAEHYGLDRRLAVAGPNGRLPARFTTRVTSDLQALYTFAEGSGDTIRDLSGAGAALDLKIAHPSAVRWSDNGLTVHAPTRIATAGPPRRLTAAIRAAQAVTLEAWITPADTQQNGPARLLTLSSGTSQRNFTLGQEGDKYEVRFRTRRTSANGQPSVDSPRRAVETRPTHVVYTRDAAGKAKLYIDGQEKGARDIPGELSNWDDRHLLMLANESTTDRPWRGVFHLVAVYSRALTPAEVRRHHAAGWPQDQGLARYDVSSVPGRGGLLTQGSVLTVGGDEASMVARGLFVLHDILSSKVEDPPPCVDTTPVPTQPGLTQRSIALTRLADRACAGCHGKFEPLAFGLEKFDGIGAYHDQDEHGNRLRDDGEILFPGSDKPVAYRSSAELMDLLAASARVRETFTLKVTQFALGRPLVKTDAPFLKEIHQAAQEGGGTYASLITAIVLSDLVRKTRTEKTP